MNQSCVPNQTLARATGLEHLDDRIFFERYRATTRESAYAHVVSVCEKLEFLPVRFLAEELQYHFQPNPNFASAILSLNRRKRFQAGLQPPKSSGFWKNSVAPKFRHAS